MQEEKHSLKEADEEYDLLNDAGNEIFRNAMHMESEPNQRACARPP